MLMYWNVNVLIIAKRIRARNNFISKYRRTVGSTPLPSEIEEGVRKKAKIADIQVVCSPSYNHKDSRHGGTSQLSMALKLGDKNETLITCPPGSNLKNTTSSRRSPYRPRPLTRSDTDSYTIESSGFRTRRITVLFSEVRFTMVTFYIVLIYMGCFLPYGLNLMLIQIWGTYIRHLPIISLVCIFLAPVIMPILYIFVGKYYKRDISKLVRINAFSSKDQSVIRNTAISTSIPLDQDPGIETKESDGSFKQVFADVVTFTDSVRSK